MCVLPESKASVTELFTVADFHSVVIKSSISTDPMLSSSLRRQLSLIKIIKHDFPVNYITFFRLFVSFLLRFSYHFLCFALFSFS